MTFGDFLVTFLSEIWRFSGVGVLKCPKLVAPMNSAGLVVQHEMWGGEYAQKLSFSSNPQSIRRIFPPGVLWKLDGSWMFMVYKIFQHSFKTLSFEALSWAISITTSWKPPGTWEANGIRARSLGGKMASVLGEMFFDVYWVAEILYLFRFCESMFLPIFSVLQAWIMYKLTYILWECINS